LLTFAAGTAASMVLLSAGVGFALAGQGSSGCASSLRCSARSGSPSAPGTRPARSPCKRPKVLSRTRGLTSAGRFSQMPKSFV
jgi:hypothetical protein